jgi:cytochrome c-type biogenesis protein
MGSDINLAIAFAAGVLSFLSPCVLPLIPSYLSFVTGASLSELQGESTPRMPIFLRTLFFVVGFSLVFVVLGVLFSGSGFLLAGASRWINGVAGTVVVLLGLNVMFDFAKSLNFEKRLHVSSRPTSYAGAGLVGMAFGAGWSPCIGPILAGILFMAGSSGEVGRGILYLSIYSIGLGLPFLLAALFFTRVSTLLNRMKRYLGTIRVASGLLLVALGLLIAFGQFQALSGAIVSAGVRLEQWHSANPGSSRLLFASLLLLLGALWPVVRLLRGKDLRRPLGAGLSAVFVGLAALEAAGVTEVALLFAKWLTFQGI